MKIFKRIILLTIAIVIIYAAVIAQQAMNIISAYGAKDLCSCVYVSGRNPKEVITNELNFWPVFYGSFKINSGDSSATGKVLGIATQKAIFRKGLGCSLLTGMTEEEFRHQKINLVQPQPINADTIAWPNGDKLPDTISQKIDKIKLQAAIDQAFVETDTAHEKLLRTRAVVAVYNGQLIGERYAKGFDKNTKQMGWSMNKSFTNALIGILVKQGKIKLEDSAPVDAWATDDRKNITINNLMQMRSGLHWVEYYSVPQQSVTIMLYSQKDMGVFAANQKLETKPGEKFYYSSGTTNILSRIIRDKVGDENYYQFPFKELFEKIGMHNTVIEPDAGGTFVGSSYIFASARDFTRFGLLFLNDGMWNGGRILPEGWVKYSSTTSGFDKSGSYGAQWWTNTSQPNNQSPQPYPDIPSDAFCAIGHESQYIFVVPSKKLVVLRLGLTEGNFNINKLVSGIIQSLPQ
jgi:CubicO group peptidase (beta-lactamase class C family)